MIVILLAAAAAAALGAWNLYGLWRSVPSRNSDFALF